MGNDKKLHAPDMAYQPIIVRGRTVYHPRCGLAAMLSETAAPSDAALADCERCKRLCAEAPQCYHARIDRIQVALSVHRHLYRCADCGARIPSKHLSRTAREWRLP